MFLSALSEFLRLSSEGVALSSRSPRSSPSPHPYAELSFTVHPASPTFSSLSVPVAAAAAAPPKCPMELDSCQRRAPGGRGTAFHSASSVPSPVFRGLRE